MRRFEKLKETRPSPQPDMADPEVLPVTRWRSFWFLRGVLEYLESLGRAKMLELK